MLIGNYTVLNKLQTYNISGLSIAQTRSNYMNSGNKRNIFTHFNPSSSIPNGYRNPYCWVIPQTGGGLASYTNIKGDGTNGNLNLAGGKNGASTILGTGELTNADLALIVSAVSTILGTGEFSTNPNLSGILEAISTLAGSGDISSPVLGAILGALAELVGVSSLYNALLEATGSLSASITPFTELSPQNLAAAVWDVLISDHINSGSTGEALYGAGGGSSPTLIAEAVWDELLASHNISGSVGEKLKQVLTTGKFIALK